MHQQATPPPTPRPPCGLPQMNRVSVAPPHVVTLVGLCRYEQQLAQIWDWFRVWGSDVRNLLLNQLEEVDMTRVYKFYDELRDMRWK